MESKKKTEKKIGESASGDSLEPLEMHVCWPKTEKKGWKSKQSRQRHQITDVSFAKSVKGRQGCFSSIFRVRTARFESKGNL